MNRVIRHFEDLGTALASEESTIVEAAGCAVPRINKKRSSKELQMKIQKWLVAAGIAAAVCMSSNALAQNNGGGNGGGGGRRGGGGGPGGNFDPAQFRQNMIDRVKETLEVTKDDEWQALQPRVEKVMDARMATMGGMGRGMFGGRRNGGPGGNGGGNATDPNAGGAQPQRRGGMFGQTPMPEAEALQKAIDSKASNAEIKAAMTKYSDALKAKQDQLKAAQEDLRKLLTPRQEAIATLNGWL